MKKTLVLGASLKPDRYSNLAIVRLLAKEKNVVAFGVKSGVIEGVQIETSLVPFQDIDTITLYLNPTRQQAYYDYIISLNPRRVIFNPGTENEELSAMLRLNGILAENACTLVLLSTNQY
jgi:hypothetical protein